MKSKFEKEKEKKEEKKKQEQEAAAQVYAEFVKSFQEGADEAQGTFVRGGTYQPGTAEVAPTSEGPATYRMSAPAIHRRSGKTEMERLMDEIQGGKDKTENPREQQQPAPAGKRTKNMDAMLEEMKARRARGEAPPPVAPPKGAVPSYLDFDASATTNLHVGNLAPTVTEEQLQRRFEKYGPLLSLKVMWPRSTDERTRKKNSGFVAFIHRADADRARLALDGIELDGLPIRIGWAKAISKHSANVFPPQKHVSAAVRDAKSSEQLPVAELDRQHSGFRELEEYLTSSQSKDLAGEERTDKEGRGGKVQIPRGAAIVDVEVTALTACAYLDEATLFRCGCDDNRSPGMQASVKPLICWLSMCTAMANSLKTPFLQEKGPTKTPSFGSFGISIHWKELIIDGRLVH